MTIFMSLGGNTSGDGFLLAPGGTTYDADLALWTDSGTASVTLQASPNPAGLVFSQTMVNISTIPTVVKVHATMQSGARGDTTIQVLDGMNVVINFTVTSIKHPVVHFKGRFEVRFATDGSYYNRNPIYTAVLDNVVPPGWTWGLEGEADFVPAMGNVPENLETPVGRVLRYNNPVALRSHAAPVVSTVDSISGETTNTTETFTSGDPLIGQLVNLGPNTYLAGNNPINPMDPQPEESWDAALEPMALFEIHLGNMFSGASQVGPFVAKAVTTNVHTRTPDSRPIANGLVNAAAELAEFGLPSLSSFSDTRIDQLVADYNALPAGPSIERRNLARRIGHLLSSVTPAKKTAVMNANPNVFTVRQGTLTGGWPNKEIYTGMVDTNLSFSPSGSSVVAYMSGFTLFKFVSNMLAFHSDELCGYHKGTLTCHVLSNGAYTGDPHTKTVDGTTYDFQSVGEFTLLCGAQGFEVQVRQTPVPAATPITDSHTGLTSCVSIITAVAARVGAHRISLQPGREGSRLQFYLDGKPAAVPNDGLDLGEHRVTRFDASGDTGIRVDYADGTVLTVTPNLWTTYNVHYINVSVSQTPADEGIMGLIPNGSWLPRLRNGASVGTMPAGLHDRYTTLYKKFADSWRITPATSLFVYAPGTSTAAFTDTGWPAEKPPCKLKPQLHISGMGVLKSIPVAKAELICNIVTEKDLHRNCVFDVATTGDKIFAKGYYLAQELRLYGTRVLIEGHRPPSRPDRVPGLPTEEQGHPLEESLIVTATVSPLTPGRPVPTGGCVTFFVDGVPLNRPVPLDGRGRARTRVTGLKLGEHRIRAVYSGCGKHGHHSSSSRSLIYVVARRPDDKRKAEKGRLAPRGRKGGERLVRKTRSKTSSRKR